MPLESSDSSFSFISRSELPALNEAIARNATWQRLWHWLGLPDPQLAPQTRSDDWWAISPFSPSEKSPSFHMNAKGWCCFSTGQNGSYLNLVSELLGKNIYHAAHEVRKALLLDAPFTQTLPEPLQVRQSFQGESVTPLKQLESPNLPIQADLTKSRYFSASDPRFDSRSIPVEVFQALGAGYLDRPASHRRHPDHLNHRHVFQVRGVEKARDSLRSVILTHMGRASSVEQAGKWWIYPAFQARYELYNIDLALTQQVARDQAQSSGHVVVVEGAYDVAKLYAAGIHNVVATFGKHLYEEQLPRFKLLADELRIRRFLIFFDRGQDGASQTSHGRTESGAIQAAERLNTTGFQTDIFQWNRTFSNTVRQDVSIPLDITDPEEFTITALQWFRFKGLL